MPDIAVDLDSNILWISSGAGFEAESDYVVILQDDYRSGYECARCLDENKISIDRVEVSTIVCEACNGTGNRAKAGNPDLQVKCSDCSGRGAVVCPDCGGKGGNIVIADDAKGRPMTGLIVSIGPDVKKWERGKKCMYPAYAGHAYTMKDFDRKGRKVEIVLLIIRETDIIVRLHGTLEQNAVKRSMALHTNA